MGQQPPPPPPYHYPPPHGYPGPPGWVQQPPTNPLAITGMILGIVSIPLVFLLFFDIPIGIAGLILSIVGLSHSGRLGGSGRGMAIAGIATSAVGTLIAVIISIAVIAAG
jgi:hypothetical protein